VERLSLALLLDSYPKLRGMSAPKVWEIERTHQRWNKELINNSPVDKFSTEVIVSAVIYDLNDAVFHMNDSGVEGATAHVIH